MFKKTFLILTALVLVLSVNIVSCKRRDKNLGSEKNPVIVSFMPSGEEAVMKKNADVIAQRLKEQTGLNVKAFVAKDFITMIDDLGGKEIDVAFINSLGYLLAHDWCGANAILQLKGVDGKKFYRSAIITYADSGIKSLEGLNGKSFAYTDPYSMAGYLMPLEMFADKKVTPSSTSFLENYDEVVEQIYNKKFDGGAIYYHKPDPYGRIRDARERLVEKYPDVLDRVPIIAMSDPIPNTPVVFRKKLPEEVKTKLTQAFMNLDKDPRAVGAIGEMYDATGFVPSSEEEFNQIREILKKLGKTTQEVVPGALTFFKTHIWEIVPEY